MDQGVRLSLGIATVFMLVTMVFFVGFAFFYQRRSEVIDQIDQLEFLVDIDEVQTSDTILQLKFPDTPDTPVTFDMFTFDLTSSDMIEEAVKDVWLKQPITITMPCGYEVTYTASTFPRVNTPCPCGKEGRWIVEYNIMDSAPTAKKLEFLVDIDEVQTNEPIAATTTGWEEIP